MIPEKKGLTLADLLAIDDDNRYELIDGELYLLTTPVPAHVIVSSNLVWELFSFFDEKNGNIYFAPADICLFHQPKDADSDIYTVVQPDIFVICDPSQIGEKRFYGPPTLIVEILSPSTASMDRFVKYLKYQEAGVKEYWIVDPKHKNVSVYTLRDGHYAAGEAYNSGEVLHSETFAGLEVPLGGIFPD